MNQRNFRYCPHCATEFVKREIHQLDRLVCPSCNFIFWQNPVVGVAVILEQQGKLLLGRRSRGVYQGQWCIPCGYVEYHEDVRDAAVREFQEETGIEVQLGDVFTVHSNFHNPVMHSVGIWFLGEIKGGELAAADDLDKVGWCSEESIKTLPLAFETDRLVIDAFYTRLNRT